MDRTWRGFDIAAIASILMLIVYTAVVYRALPEHFPAKVDADDIVHLPWDRVWTTWVYDAAALGVWTLVRFGKPGPRAAFLVMLWLVGYGAVEVWSGLNSAKAIGGVFEAVEGGWALVCAWTFRTRRSLASVLAASGIACIGCGLTGLTHVGFVLVVAVIAIVLKYGD